MIKKLEQLKEVRAMRLKREIKILQQAREKQFDAKSKLSALYDELEKTRKAIKEMKLLKNLGTKISVVEMEAFFDLRKLSMDHADSLSNNAATLKGQIEELDRLIQQQQLIVNKARLKSETIETQIKQYKIERSRSRQRSEDSLSEESFRAKPNSLK